MAPTKKAVVSIGSLISLLAAGNLFFVHRLVDEIDNTGTEVKALREDMAVVKYALGIRDQARVTSPAPKISASRKERKPGRVAWLVPKQ